MSNSDAGKGDSYRPVDRKKWDAWWKAWETKQEERRNKERKEDDKRAKKSELSENSGGQRDISDD